MRNDQSTFIKELGYMIDEFDELQDLRWSDLVYLAEYRELSMKKNDGLPIDQARLNQLEPRFKNKIVTSSRWNKFQNALIGMQTFIKEEVEEFILDMQLEMTDFVYGKIQLIDNTVADGIKTMGDKRDYFVTFVNVKMDEIRDIAHELDSDVAIYETSWAATEGQVDYNIFQGSNKEIPMDANLLNIEEKNVLLIVSGTVMSSQKDFTIDRNNGLYDTIRLAPSGQSLIEAGTEVSARWIKNVGKLYTKHAHSHGEGARDALTVTKGMLETPFQNELMYVPVRSSVAPDPSKHKIWIKTIAK